MRKIFLTFIALTFAHIVFAQNKQTIVVRPETALEKTVRETKDAKEVVNFFGEALQGAAADRLNEVRTKSYSEFIEKKLEIWKEKGAFEKTADWQRRLNDSTSVKKVEIYDSSLEEFVRSFGTILGGVNSIGGLFYDSQGYDADKEVLSINTAWCSTEIPIPLEEAKNMQYEFQNLNVSFLKHSHVLKPRFFIQDDHLMLLSLTFVNKGKSYTWSNHSADGDVLLVAMKSRARSAAVLDSLCAVAKRVSVELTIKEFGKALTLHKSQQNSAGLYSATPPPVYNLDHHYIKKLNYPKSAVIRGVEGTVVVSFTVSSEGAVTDVVVESSVDQELDKEAVRLIKHIGGWSPARMNHTNVSSKLTLPIVFKLTDYTAEELEAMEQERLAEEARKKQEQERIADSTPTFPGGYAALSQFVYKNLKSPFDLNYLSSTVVVHVQFTVSKTGKISDIIVLKTDYLPRGEDTNTVDRSLRAIEKAAVKVVRKMPDWVPAKLGEDASVTLPFTFRR